MKKKITASVITVSVLMMSLIPIKVDAYWFDDSIRFTEPEFTPEERFVYNNIPVKERLNYRIIPKLEKGIRFKFMDSEVGKYGKHETHSNKELEKYHESWFYSDTYLELPIFYNNFEQVLPGETRTIKAIQTQTREIYKSQILNLTTSDEITTTVGAKISDLFKTKEASVSVSNAKISSFSRTNSITVKLSSSFSTENSTTYTNNTDKKLYIGYQLRQNFRILARTKISYINKKEWRGWWIFKTYKQTEKIESITKTYEFHILPENDAFLRFIAYDTNDQLVTPNESNYEDSVFILR